MTGMFLQKLRRYLFAQNTVTPLERFTKDIQWVGNFNSPEAYYEYYFVDRQSGIVGELGGGMSPLHDTFYLFKIDVPLKHRRGHYEASMLANIAEFYNAPITPMHEIDPGILERLRKLDPGYFQLKAQISADKMAAEILKWTQHHRILDLHAKQYRADKICS